MDPELKTKIESLLELTEQNNVMLKKMRRIQKNAHTFSILKLIIILALIFWGYTYLKPYINNMNSLYNSTLQIINPGK